MKKLNKKGFTLIELLAVIVIMGILMFVAIPAVSRTIENSRKDTFKDTAKQYVNQVKTLWASDGLMCGTSTSSSLSSGDYYVAIDSTDPWLLEQGGKSSWGNNEMTGYVLIEVTETTDPTTLKTRVTQTYSIAITDSHNHGIAETQYDALVRGSVQNVNSFTIPSTATQCFEA